MSLYAFHDCPLRLRNCRFLYVWNCRVGAQSNVKRRKKKCAIVSAFEQMKITPFSGRGHIERRFHGTADYEVRSSPIVIFLELS